MTDILGQTDEKLKSKFKIQSLKRCTQIENLKSGLGNQSTYIPFWIYNRQTDGNDKWQPKSELKIQDFKNQNRNPKSSRLVCEKIQIRSKKSGRWICFKTKSTILQKRIINLKINTLKNQQFWRELATTTNRINANGGAKSWRDFETETSHPHQLSNITIIFEKPTYPLTVSTCCHLLFSSVFRLIVRSKKYKIQMTDILGQTDKKLKSKID